MLFFIIVIFFIVIVFYIVKNKIRINWGSFFHRGFKKTDNKFGLIVFDGKQRLSVRHIPQSVFVLNKN